MHSHLQCLCLNGACNGIQTRPTSKYKLPVWFRKEKCTRGWRCYKARRCNSWDGMNFTSRRVAVGWINVWCWRWDYTSDCRCNFIPCRITASLWKQWHSAINQRRLMYIPAARQPCRYQGTLSIRLNKNSHVSFRIELGAELSNFDMSAGRINQCKRTKCHTEQTHE